MPRDLFGANDPVEYFRTMVAPNYQRFLQSNSDVEAAISTATYGHHLYEKRFGKKFSKDDFKKSPPTALLKSDVLETARIFANSVKHPTVQIETKKQTGFSSSFSKDFARPLNLRLESGQEVSMDDFLMQLVGMWKNELGI